MAEVALVGRAVPGVFCRSPREARNVVIVRIRDEARGVCDGVVPVKLADHTVNSVSVHARGAVAAFEMVNES